MKRRPLVLLLTGVLLILSVLRLFGCSFFPRRPGDREAEELLTLPVTCLISGTVTETSLSEQFSSVHLTDVTLYYKDSSLRISDVRLICPEDTVYPAGCRLLAEGVPEVIEGVMNPGQFDASLYAALQKVRYSMKSPSIRVVDDHVLYFKESLLVLRRKLKKRILRLYPDENAAVLCALLIGDKSVLSDDQRSLWQTGGILHMLAISGLHLTLLGSGLYRILRFFRLSPRISGALSSCAMILYTVFTGCAVSTLRALLMFLLRLLALRLGRTYDPLTALAAAVLLMLIENPLYLFYSGFQMSCGAILCSSALQHRSRGIQVLGMNLLMLPLTLLNYFKIPLFGLIVNLAVVPFLPAVLVTGMIGTALGSAFPLFTFPCSFLLNLLTRILKSVRSVPHSSVIIGKPSAPQILFFCFSVFLFLYFTDKYRCRKRRFFFFLLLIPAFLCLRPLPERRLSLLFQSVGQGDCLLITTPDGFHLLIDGGSTTVQEAARRRIIPCLEHEGVSTLDYVFLTHADEDHINGIEELFSLIEHNIAALQIRTIVLPLTQDQESRNKFAGILEASSRLGVRILYVSDGDRLTIGSMDLNVMNPQRDVPAQADTNAQSIVLALHYGRFDALLTGDVSGEGEAHLIQKLKKSGEPYECLKVAHHGSRYSTPTELLEILRPEVSIISCGKNNSYGHPHDTLLQRLSVIGSEVFRTDLDGAVRITTDGSSFSVETVKACSRAQTAAQISVYEAALPARVQSAVRRFSSLTGLSTAEADCQSIFLPVRFSTEN